MVVLWGGGLFLMSEVPPQVSEGDHIAVLILLDLYHTSPDAGERQYKSRTWRKRFDPALRAGSTIPVPMRSQPGPSTAGQRLPNRGTVVAAQSARRLQDMA